MATLLDLRWALRIVVTFGLCVVAVTDHQQQMVLPSSADESRTLPSSAADLDRIHETLSLLEAGETNILLGEQSDVVLVLGVTGSGKSTLTQFLSDDADALVATRRHGVFLINDVGNKRIGNSTITSKTVYPELVVDPTTSTAFYDCPGFSDTRSPSHDIAASYFIKRVFDHAQRVKMMLTIAFSSVEVGNDREGFVSLLSHVCALVSDVDKFANSILIVVTKVRNDLDDDEDDDGVSKTITDEVVIGNIAGFMTEVRDTLVKRNNSKNDDAGKRSFYSCRVKLIDIFILKVGDTYTRIGIFRRPEKKGPLSKSELLVRGKQNIVKILSEHTTYTTKNKDDFSYTISDSSKYYITNTLNRILNVEIMDSLKKLADKIETKVVEECVHFVDMYKLQLKLDYVDKSLGSLAITYNTFHTPKEFIDKVNITTETVGVYGEDILVNVSRQIGYLEDFQRFSKDKGEYFSIAHGSQKFLQAREFVCNLENWYVLLIELYDKHSNYHQSHKKSNNVRDLVRLGNDDLMFHVDENNVNTFLPRVANNTGHNSFRSLLADKRVGAVALRDLNNIMSLAYKQYVDSCEESLETALDELAKQIKVEYRNKCSYFKDMRELQQVLRVASESLQTLTQTRVRTTNAFKVELTKTVQVVGISGQSPLMHIDNLMDHHKSFENFTSDKGTNSNQHVWSNVLKPTAEYIGNLDSWYVAILDIHNGLISKSLETNSVQNNGTYWVVNPGQSIDENNMHAFLLKTKIPTYDRLLSDAATVEIVLRDLNNLAHLASTPAASCEDRIIRDLNNIDIAIQAMFRLQCVDSHDMQSLQRSLGLGYNTLQTLAETNHTNASEFINKLLINAMQDMSVPMNRVSISRITKLIPNLQYFQGFCVSETKHFISSKWASVLLPAKNYVFGLNSWYTLLLSLHRKLSEYSFQKDTTKYNVSDLSYWGVGSPTQGIYIDRNNIRTFLQKVQNLKLDGFNLIDASNVEDVVLRDLNRILQLTLVDSAEKTEHNGVLTIQGQYVVISKFSELFHPIKYKAVRVFALHTVFIDADIERTAEAFQLTIIAPTWDVRGSRKIVLTGATGANYLPPKVKKQSSGGTEDKAGRGDDGNPGNPGSLGGSFFGVGHVFLRGDALTVSSRGGVGGRGQDGGDGEDGFRQAELDHKETLEVLANGWRGRERYEIVFQWSYGIIRAKKIKVFQVGVGGSEGGDGGSGGKGGIGGHSGQISIINLGRESGINIEAIPGSEGIGGQSGHGGNGGYNAKPLLVGWFQFFPTVIWISEEYPGEELPGGNQGSASLNSKGRLLPHRSTQNLPKSEFINMFKSYSWFNLKSATIYSTLGMFLETLERNVESRSTYNTSSYVQELKYLDAASNATDGNVDLTVYYTHIVESSHSYSQSSSRITPEERIVLQYVRTAAHSRICRMRARADRSLITDLSRFLDHAKSYLPKLANFRTYQEIDQINKNYKISIELKITEAYDFIKHHTSVEVNEVVGEIETNIQELVHESKTLQQKARDHKYAIYEYEKKLKAQTILKSIFSVLKLGSSVLPVVSSASAVFTVIGAATIFADTVTGLTEVKAPEAQTNPQGLINTIIDMERNSAYNSKERNLVKFFTLTDTIVREIGAGYSQLNQLRAVIVEIKSNLTDSATYSLARARGDLERAVALAALDLLPDDIKEKEKLDTIATLISKSDSSLDILAKYKTRIDLASSGSAELQAAEKTIKELEIYEDQIHETFVPLLKNMHQSLTSIEGNLANQSHAYVDVSRWQVQKCIRNVKHFVQQATRGFHAGDKLERSVSKFEEISDLLINLYDRIETYQEEKRTGDLVSSINKAHAQGIVIRDPKLKAAVTDLQMVITSNTIITQYNRALNAFKQQIFPFANLYQDLLNEDLRLDGKANIAALATRVDEKIQLLISAVSDTKSTIQNVHDSNVITKVFNSKYLTSRPFFTWGNQIFNEEISRLLSGEEVFLKAGLTIGPNYENAVKFSLIHLNVRATNERWQAELDQVINHFDVRLKHFGNSHYRCGDQFYVIGGESQTFTYSFENYNSTALSPIRSNQVYKKIKAGDISLSPYAMWSMKLVSRTSGFEKLSTFKGMVNLELVGEGQYVEGNADVCQSSLYRYYDVYKD